MSEIHKNAKTLEQLGEPWHSPDNKVTIWTIKIEIDGEPEVLATMSEAVGSVGFVGDVEIYTNDKGKTYVRKAPKEEQSAGPQDQNFGYRCNALNNATAYAGSMAMSIDDIPAVADHLLAWLMGEIPSTKMPADFLKTDGYSKARATADRMKVQSAFNNGEPLPAYEG